MFQGKFKTDATMGDGIPYKFIVVYDKFTKVVANSIKNQSVIKNIRTTIIPITHIVPTTASAIVICFLSLKFPKFFFCLFQMFP